MPIAEVVSPEDAVIFKAAADEPTAKVKGSGARSSFQSGESRAWGRSGNVD